MMIIRDVQAGFDPTQSQIDSTLSGLINKAYGARQYILYNQNCLYGKSNLHGKFQGIHFAAFAPNAVDLNLHVERKVHNSKIYKPSIQILAMESNKELANQTGLLKIKIDDAIESFLNGKINVKELKEQLKALIDGTEYSKIVKQTATTLEGMRTKAESKRSDGILGRSSLAVWHLFYDHIKSIKGIRQLEFNNSIA